jgi:hypothetical protein
MPDAGIAPEQANEVIIGPQSALPALHKWFGDAMVSTWGTPPTPERRWLLMGCPAWGDYANRLVNWTIPTLLAPDNLAALTPCWMVIFTDPLGYPTIHTSTKQLRQLGIQPIIKLIPKEVLDEARKHPANRYWILGCAQNILIRMADYYGSGFHMLQPDHLYAQSFIKNLRRLAPQHHMIAQTGISAEIEPATRELEKWRDPRGWIAIPDRDLGDIGARNLHRQTNAYLMNGATVPTDVEDAGARLPNAHFLCWRGKTSIVSHCCHMNAVWLSPGVCREAPNFLPATLDTRLPQLHPDFYVPTPEDNMTFIEVSGHDKAWAKQLVGFDMFAAKCWAQTGFNLDYMPYFRRPSVTPAHLQDDGMADEEIAAQASKIADLLWSVRPPKWMQMIQQMPMGQ